MSINAKPYAIGDKLRKRIYYPSPYIYAHVDRNQERDAHVDAMEKIADRLGAITENLLLNLNTLTLTDNGGGSYTLDYDFSIDTSGSATYLYHKGVRFELPLYEPSGSITQAGLPLFAVWLVAKKRTIDFATDPVKAGIDGTLLPSARASSDVEEWYDERLVIVEDTNLPTLSTGEEIICKVVSLVYVNTNYQDVTTNNFANNYQPHLCFDAPPVEDFMSSYHKDIEPGSILSAKNLFESVGRLWLKSHDHEFKCLQATNLSRWFYATTTTPTDGDIWIASTVSSATRFRRANLNSLIRDVEHTHTKKVIHSTAELASAGYVAQTSDTTKGWIVIGDNNNVGVTVPKDKTVLDIVVSSDGTTTTAAPTGTVVTLQITHGAGTADSIFGAGISALPGYALSAMSIEGNWVLRKTATTWIILAAPSFLAREMAQFSPTIKEKLFLPLLGQSPYRDIMGTQTDNPNYVNCDLTQIFGGTPYIELATGSNPKLDNALIYSGGVSFGGSGDYNNRTIKSIYALVSYDTTGASNFTVLAYDKNGSTALNTGTLSCANLEAIEIPEYVLLWDDAGTVAGSSFTPIGEDDYLRFTFQFLATGTCKMRFWGIVINYETTLP